MKALVQISYAEVGALGGRFGNINMEVDLSVRFTYIWAIELNIKIVIDNGLIYLDWASS